jgi:hypothetical protein
MRLPNLGGLMQQPPNKRDALAASRLGAERAIHHRYGAVFALDMSPEVTIGDAVAETDVHSCSYSNIDAVHINSRCANNSQYHLCR